jgi:hypothetical protein
MSLFEEIQQDLLSSASLSDVLRKAKVLAYRLKNEDFKKWVEHELNGYTDVESLPSYRKILTHSCGNFLTFNAKISDVPIPSQNIPREVRGEINRLNMKQGAKELEAQLESLARSQTDTLVVPWPNDLLPLLSNRVFEDSACLGAWRVLTKGHITGIVENTRNRLLTFILELTDRYPEVAKEGFNPTSSKVPDEQIRRVFNYYIMGDAYGIVSSAQTVSQGGNMTVFDQRDQNVNYQYNAAGDINFESVQNRIELVAELKKLKSELSKASSAGAIDAEIVTDAEYQITKAIQQAQKPQPDKKTIVDHLNNAKKFIDGVVVGGGMVAGLVKAIGLVQQLF